jgi:hypothetical protein
MRAFIRMQIYTIFLNNSIVLGRFLIEESDRMSVEEYFDEVWSMVLKKHEDDVVVVDRI